MALKRDTSRKSWAERWEWDENLRNAGVYALAYVVLQLAADLVRWAWR